jgi:hypothetical protein
MVLTSGERGGRREREGISFSGGPSYRLNLCVPSKSFYIEVRNLYWRLSVGRPLGHEGGSL